MTDAKAAALDLLARTPLVDAHNDVPYVIRNAKYIGRVKEYDLSKPHPETDTDIPRMKAARLGTQVFAAYTPPEPEPCKNALEQIDCILQLEELHADALMPVRKPADIGAAFKAGKIGSIIAVEGTRGLEGSLAPLRTWHRLGARIVTFCHNETLPWVDSCTDEPSRQHEGLSDFGIEIVKECNRLGIMLDVAHAAPRAMHKVLDHSRAPIMDSHCAATAISPHKRNIPDDVLARMKETGSLVCITFVPPFLSPETLAAELPFKDEYGRDLPGVDRKTMGDLRRQSIANWNRNGVALVCDHLEYFRDAVGEDHIGFGSDFYGGINPSGLEDISKYPDLIAALIERGWSNTQMEKLLNRNFISLWERVEAAAG